MDQNLLPALILGKPHEGRTEYSAQFFLLILQDGEVRKAFQRSLTKQGFKFKLGVKVNSAKVEGNSVVLDTESVKDGKKEEMTADIVLVSAGVASM